MTPAAWTKKSGLRDGLLDFLARFDSKSNTTPFQLITFKDDVTPRGATTDLSLIQQQVGALVAGGGGDIPEASVEALWETARLLTGQRNSTVILATDAPPHDGLSIPATISVLRSQGIRVNIILTDSGFPVVGSSKPGDGWQGLSSEELSTGKTGINDPISFPDLRALIPDPAFRGSVDAYGDIADGTGGILLTFNKSDTVHIRAAVQNLTASATFSTLISASPAAAPAGASLDVVIDAQNANFDETTRLAFSRDVKVNSLTPLSPVRLVANITIPTGTAVGAIDATATTGSERTSGVKLFTVQPVTTSPTLLSLYPITGVRGRTSAVTINGINTSFSATSKIAFTAADGITLSNVQVVSPTQIKADLAIAATSPATFRDLTIDGVTQRMADGETFESGALLVGEGQLLVNVPLYGGAGSLSGLLTFRNTPDISDLDGAVHWSRPAASTGTVFPQGFEVNLDTIGSRYRRKAQPVLPGLNLAPEVINAGNLQLILAGGGLVSSLTQNVSFGAAGTLSLPTPLSGSQISLDSATGLFTGSFTHSLDGQSISLGGVLFQKQALGQGGFIHLNDTGSLTLRIK